MTTEFIAWPKTPRLFRPVTITEKIDGTNACVIVGSNDEITTQSRKRIITPDDDNFGFARWAHDNAGYLADTLGEGRHYGEWWGSGIQRSYGMRTKVFSLFNTRKWGETEFDAGELRVVPMLYRDVFSPEEVSRVLERLRTFGSSAAPGFMNPEGICVYHEDAAQVFKVLLENDHLPKSAVA